MRALAIEVVASPYAGGSLTPLDGALAGNDREYRGLVAIDGERVVGVVVFGTTIGAEGAGRLYLVATDPGARRRGTGRTLIEGAIRDLRADGHRFVSVEIADDPAVAARRSLLERVGFRVEATIRDFFRDGVALTILRHDLGDRG